MEQKPEKPGLSSEEFRLRLQIETTLLVWVRTSLALMGFGFVVARFGLFLREIATVSNLHLRSHPRLARMSTFTGMVLIVLGVCVLLVAVWTHQRWITQLQRGELESTGRWSMAVILSLILAALGMGLAVYLAGLES